MKFKNCFRKPGIRPGEQEALHAIVASYGSIPLSCSVYTGARRSEVVALRWTDVNVEKKSVTIARSLTEMMTFSN